MQCCLMSVGSLHLGELRSGVWSTYFQGHSLRMRELKEKTNKKKNQAHTFQNMRPDWKGRTRVESMFLCSLTSEKFLHGLHFVRIYKFTFCTPRHSGVTVKVPQSAFLAAIYHQDPLKTRVSGSQAVTWYSGDIWRVKVCVKHTAFRACSFSWHIKISFIGHLSEHTNRHAAV